jgi:hypothetical protein
VRVGNDDDPKLRLTFSSILCTALAGLQLTSRNSSTTAVALMYAFFETKPTADPFGKCPNITRLVAVVDRNCLLNGRSKPLRTVVAHIGDC